MSWHLTVFLAFCSLLFFFPTATARCDRCWCADEMKETIITSSLGSAYGSFTNCKYLSRISLVITEAGILAAMIQGISNPPCTSGERLYRSEHNLAVTVALRSRRNFVIRDISTGRCPTVIPLILHTLMAKTSNALSISCEQYSTYGNCGCHIFR